MGIAANLYVNEKGLTTSLKQPKEISFYSRTQTGEYLVHDYSKLKYYYFPDADIDKNFDLTGGLKKFKDCEAGFSDYESLHGVLKSLKAYEQTKQKKVKVDIISTRDTISKLILTAFYNQNINPIDLRLVSFDGQIFIKAVPQPRKTPTIELETYVNYKFETLSTLSQPLPFVSRETLSKRNKKISNNGDKFVSIIKTGVGSSKLLLGTDIDCIFDFKEDGKDNLRHYTKLACSSSINSVANTKKFENNIFRNWLRCFLAGIPRITYAFKDENSILKSVEEYSTDEVPVLLKENNPDVGSKCIDAIKWYGLFTEWLLKIIPREESSLVRAFKLVLEDNHLKLSEIESDDEEFQTLVNGEAILSNDFKQWRKSLEK